MTGKRFIVVDNDEAQNYADPFDYAYPNDHYDVSGFLVDTEKHEVVFCDYMEPEDATLGRDLRPLVDLLNELSAT